MSIDKSYLYKGDASTGWQGGSGSNYGSNGFGSNFFGSNFFGSNFANQVPFLGFGQRIGNNGYFNTGNLMNGSFLGGNQGGGIFGAIGGLFSNLGNGISSFCASIFGGANNRPYYDGYDRYAQNGSVYDAAPTTGWQGGRDGFDNDGYRYRHRRYNPQDTGSVYDADPRTGWQGARRGATADDVYDAAPGTANGPRDPSKAFLYRKAPGAIGYDPNVDGVPGYADPRYATDNTQDVSDQQFLAVKSMLKGMNAEQVTRMQMKLDAVGLGAAAGFSDIDGRVGDKMTAAYLYFAGEKRLDPMELTTVTNALERAALNHERIRLSDNQEQNQGRIISPRAAAAVDTGRGGLF